MSNPVAAVLLHVAGLGSWIWDETRPYLLNIMLRLAGTKPPDSAIIKSLGNDLSGEQRGRMVNRCIPESSQRYLSNCEATIPNTHTMYIKNRKDNKISGVLQEKMAQNLRAK